MGDLLGSPRVAPLLPFLRFIFFPRFRFPLFLYSLLHESSFRAISSSKMHCCIAEKNQMQFFVAGFNALYQLLRLNMSGPIIPALMHRIPSELRSQACLGESSTRMGDLLGSPRVAPLLPFLRFIFFPRFRFPLFLYSLLYESSFRAISASKMHCCIAEERQFFVAGFNALYQLLRLNMSGAIIPALMHRIPSELRS